jgi:predicted permease
VNGLARSLIGELWQDLRYAFRQWRLAPVFTLTALLVLAAGTGATLALFGLFDALVVRPLAVPHPGELVAFSAVDPKRPFYANMTPLDAFEPFRRGQAVFSHVAAYLDGSEVVETNGVLAEARLAFVDESYFDVLEVGPQIGRLITADDMKSGAHVVVMSDGEWRRHYAGNPGVVGQIIRLQAKPFTVVGVASPRFSGLEVDAAAAFALPISTARELFASEGLNADEPVPLGYGVGRLRPGLTLADARAQLQSLWPAIRQTVVPANFKGAERDEFLSLQLDVTSAARGFSMTRDWYAAPLSLLAAATAWLLIVVCANLAGLMLARAISRQGEMAIRAALGASRARLIRQWLTEGLLLSITGTALGLPIAWWGARVLAHLIYSIWAEDPSFRLDLAPDWRVTVAVIGSAIVTGLVIALGPAWRASRRPSPHGTRLTMSAGTSRWTDRLLTGQVALALVMLVGAALFARNLSSLRHINPGFRTVGTSIVEMSPQPGRNLKQDPVAYSHTLHDRLMALPGVQAVAFSDVAPVWGFAPGEDKTVVAPAEAPPEAGGVESTFVSISPGFFQALDIPFRAGRDIQWSDGPGRRRVGIVSTRLAEKLFGRDDPIGRRIRAGSSPEMREIEIVGVSSDARLADLHTTEPLFVFLPMLQAIHEEARAPQVIVVRWTGAFGPLQPMIAREVQSLGQSVAYEQVTVGQQIERSLLRERLLAIGGYGFGGVAIAVVAIGLFGLLASSVAARTREIGIRSALGASSTTIQLMIVKRSARIALAGIAIGLPLTWVATRPLGGVLTAIGARDVVSLAIAVAAIVCASLLAAWWPARRAAGVDPMTALRAE